MEAHAPKGPGGARNEGDARWSLKIDGAVHNALELSFEALESLPGEWKVADVGALLPGFSGSAVRLKALLEKAQPSPEATHVTFHASDGFAASVALKDAEGALLVYKLEGRPLPARFGWPTRVLIPRGPSECANVKSVVRIEVTVGKGKDTTPQH